jgi:hypothetical protein
MALRQDSPAQPLSELLAEASREVVGAPLAYSETALAEILSPCHFVAVRGTLGGPAPAETARAAAASCRQLEADERWRRLAAEALAKAERALAERSAAL